MLLLSITPGADRLTRAELHALLDVAVDAIDPDPDDYLAARTYGRDNLIDFVAARAKLHAAYDAGEQ